MKAGWGVTSAVLGLWLSTALGGAALAEAWVQIEAKPSLREAEARARDWAAGLPDVAGHAMSTGWYAIALGPFADTGTAEDRLRVLRGEGLIPADSYVSDGRNYRQQFWPVAGARPAPAAAPEATPAPVATPLAEPAAEPVETLARSREIEAALTSAERTDIQTALQWQGHYTGAIDGAFGRGTRAAISAWQGANGHPETGVLSTAQRAALLDRWQAERDALGLATVEDAEAGIAIDLPLGLVEFDHYEPPFVHYREKDDSGVRVLLISRPGDSAALEALYTVMQGLEIVPPQGDRRRDRAGFVLTGQDARIHSHTEARLQGGLIKGFTLVHPAQDGARMGRVLAAMRDSFRPVGTRALDEGLGQPLALDRAAMLAGLDLRRPLRAQSGFYITGDGAVLTAAQGVAQCGRVTIDGVEADLAFADPAAGIAVLTPRAPLAPAAVAGLRAAPPRPGTEIAVAGYSYPEALSAPVLTFGRLSDLTGLNGEPGLARLAATTLPGDAGGPVLDGTGAVIAILMSQTQGDGKLLPPDLSLARPFDVIAPLLAERGFAPAPAQDAGTRAAEDLGALARDMTVRVDCWD